MKIVLCGGGTGGHITPLLAVANELKKIEPKVELIYIGEKDGRFANLVENNPMIDKYYKISAGKFRRYHNESWFTKIADVKTNALNSRDLIRFLRGLRQSKRLLKKVRPDVIFIKGGFVGVPVGLAAGKLNIPYITHDSDTLPGLANRIIAKKAAAHAVGMPASFYNYPSGKTYYVGIPIPEKYRFVDDKLKKQYRLELDLPRQGRVLLVTGGSLGAERLNNAVVNLAPKLLIDYSDLTIIHQTGRQLKKLYENLKEDLRPRLIRHDFIDDMYRYSGAADVIITRAGATTLAEFAAQGKPCIVVPSEVLTGGHQLKNAQYLSDQDAVKLVRETQINSDPQVLMPIIKTLLDSQNIRDQLGLNFFKQSKQNAARELAQLIIKVARKN